jgi:hypothetical protein
MICQRALLILLVGVGLSMGSSAKAAPVFTLDFETEDDFATPLTHGQSISSHARSNHTNPFVPFSDDSVMEFGNLVDVKSTVIGSDGHLGIAVFDSDPPPTASNDADLLVGIGNLLMLQADENPKTDMDPTYGLVFDHPSDERTHADRGSIVFDFLVPSVHPMSLDLVDVDRGVHMEVILTDHVGMQRTYMVPTEWTTDAKDAFNGYQTLNLETLANQPSEPNAAGGDATASEDSGFNNSQVVRLEVRILGSSPSGGIDNLMFSIPEPNGLLLIGAGIIVALCGYGRSVRDDVTWRWQRY